LISFTTLELGASDIIVIIIPIIGAIFSSSVLATYLEYRLKDRAEGKRVRSLIIGYLESVHTQLPSTRAYLKQLILFPVYTEKMLPLLHEASRELRLVGDASYFDMIRRELLKVDAKLAGQVMDMNGHVSEYNDTIDTFRNGLTESSAAIKVADKMSEYVSGFLLASRPFMNALDEYGAEISKQTADFKRALLNGATVNVNWNLLEAKSDELEEASIARVQSLHSADTRKKV
jgi:hypothetical protein